MKGFFTRTHLFSIFLLLFFVLFWFCQREDKARENSSNFNVTGLTMGVVSYNVKYIDPRGINYKAGIDSLLDALNQSLSTYVKESEITRFNNNSLLKYESEFFYPVLKAGYDIFKVTNGAFDPTIMPVVNAWGFGPEEFQNPDSATIETLMTNVGFDHIFFDSIAICKLEQGVKLDFSAIAKGYAVDLVLGYLQKKDIHNIFVEIGGEVAAIGRNVAENKSWMVGVEDPTKSVDQRSVFAAFKIEDRAVATSGNYRNFKLVDGKKIGHTIDPKTGYPVENNLLSASVFAQNCMEADAYATAFMVLGKEKSIEIIEQNQNLQAYLIFLGENGELLTYISSNLMAQQLN